MTLFWLELESWPAVGACDRGLCGSGPTATIESRKPGGLTGSLCAVPSRVPGEAAGGFCSAYKCKSDARANFERVYHPVVRTICSPAFLPGWKTLACVDGMHLSHVDVRWKRAGCYRVDCRYRCVPLAWGLCDAPPPPTRRRRALFKGGALVGERPAITITRVNVKMEDGAGSHARGVVEFRTDILYPRTAPGFSPHSPPKTFSLPAVSSEGVALTAPMAVRRHQVARQNGELHKFLFGRGVTLGAPPLDCPLPMLSLNLAQAWGGVACVIFFSCYKNK